MEKCHISSPAARAKKTAKIIAKALSYPKTDINFKKEIYEASAVGLLKIAAMINDKIASAMLFGHNPGMTYLANMLANVRIDNIPTCGVVCFELDIPSWNKISEDCGKLIFFEYPKIYLLKYNRTATLISITKSTSLRQPVKTKVFCLSL